MRSATIGLGVSVLLTCGTALAAHSSLPPPNGPPLELREMKAWCVKDVAVNYAAPPDRIRTGAVRKRREGGYGVDGTVDKGAEGKKPFRCRFTNKREFIDVMSLTNEGRL